MLRALEGVIDVAVAKGDSPLVGHFVTARFHLETSELPDPFRERLYTYCRGRLSPAQIPRKITMTTDP